MVEILDRGRVLVIVLSDPERFNPLSSSVLGEIKQIVESHRENPRPLLITGKGRLFSAGIDLAEVAFSSRPEDAQKPFKALVEVIDALLEYPVPTAVYLNGPAIAGGGELALATDFIYMNPNSWLEWPEVKWNIIAPMFLGLAKQSGLPRLAALNMDAGRIPANDAMSLGIAAGIFEDLEKTLEVFDKVAGLYEANKFAFSILVKEAREWKRKAVREIAFKLVDAAGSEELIMRARKFLKK